MLARQALQTLHFPALRSAWLGAAPWACTASQAFSFQQQQADGPAAYADSFRSPPQSLYYDRGQVRYPDLLEGNFVGKAILRLLGAYSRKQQLRNGASVCYMAITAAAENEELQQVLGLDTGKFLPTHHLLAVHMWLIIRKLALQGNENKDAKIYMQALYSSFFYKDMERRVYLHGVTVHVSKWLKKLEKQFYGSCFAYDKALASDNVADLSDSLLKNIYDGEMNHAEHARLLARYLRRQYACLKLTDIEEVYAGQIKFSIDINKALGSSSNSNSSKNKSSTSSSSNSNSSSTYASPAMAQLQQQ